MKQTPTKRTAFLTGLFMLCCFASQAQWSRIRNIYGGVLANDGAASFSIGGKGYVVAGSTTGQVYEYDTAANSWTLKGNAPPAMGHAFAMSFVLNGKAYIVGGDTSGQPVATVWEYDPLAKGSQWTQKRDFAGGARDAGFGFAVNNKGYAGAGFDGAGIYSDMWEYDAPSDSWTSLDAIGTSLIFPTAFVVGSKAYVLTGGTAPSGVNETKKMWCFDPATKAWSDKADFAGVGRQAAFAFGNSGYGYAGGGQANYTTVFRDMWQYNPANDQWSPAPSVPLLGPAWSSVFVIGNTAYVGLGAAFTASGLTGTDSFYKYNMARATAVAGPDSHDALWSVYPNPAGNTLILQGDIRPGVNATVYDVTGRIMIHAVPDKEKRIDLSKLPDGMYTIQLSVNGQVTGRRFAKYSECR